MKNKKAKNNSEFSIDCLLTAHQEEIVRTQIKRNSLIINLIIKKIDLLANREKCPKDANTLLRLRKQLEIEMEENDNFRDVLTKHVLAEGVWKQIEDVADPITFLVKRIQIRQKALLAQACMS